MSAMERVGGKKPTKKELTQAKKTIATLTSGATCTDGHTAHTPEQNQAGLDAIKVLGNEIGKDEYNDLERFIKEREV